MKKFFTAILAGTMAISIGVFAAGCNKTNPPDSNQTGGGKETVESVFGVGAVTTAKLLMETGAEAKPLAAIQDAAETPDAQTPADQTPDYSLPETSDESVNKAQNEAETFNKYFVMLEGFLEKGATSTVVSANDSTDPALSAYETKLVITGKNEKGEENVHTMYYSETKVENPDRFDDFDDDDDEVKTVEAYSLDGVLLMGKDESGSDIYYYMSGTRRNETETEGRETETKSELTVRASVSKDDLQNYVLMKHEIESEEEGQKSETETEYLYSVYQGGKLVESTSVDFETENKEAEYELEYTKNGVRNTYEIERVERGGNVWIKVEYNIGGNLGKFVIVRDGNGEFDYKFTEKQSDDRHFN